MTPRLRAVLPLLVDVVGPVLVYLVLHRLFGFGDVLALTVGGLVGGVGVAVEALRTRRIDRLGVFVLALFALSIALIAVTGDARVVLVKPAVVTAAAGLYCLATLRGRPLVMDTGRPFVAAVGPGAVQAWETGWRELPRMRRAIRGLTVLWGAALVGESVARAVVVYTQPLDTAVWASQLPGFALVTVVAVTGLVMRRLRPVLRSLAGDAASVSRAGPPG